MILVCSTHFLSHQNWSVFCVLVYILLCSILNTWDLWPFISQIYVYVYFSIFFFSSSLILLLLCRVVFYLFHSNCFEFPLFFFRSIWFHILRICVLCTSLIHVESDLYHNILLLHLFFLEAVIIFFALQCEMPYQKIGNWNKKHTDVCTIYKYLMYSKHLQKNIVVVHLRRYYFNTMLLMLNKIFHLFTIRSLNIRTYSRLPFVIGKVQATDFKYHSFLFLTSIKNMKSKKQWDEKTKEIILGPLNGFFFITAIHDTDNRKKMRKRVL